MSSPVYHLYQYPSSGNCYKVRLAFAHLGTPYRCSTVDIMKGEGRASEHRQRNPNGKTPTLELPDGTYLWESNAILHYLAQGTPLWPQDRLAASRVLQWMFFEQYSHEPYIATSRYWLTLRREPDHPEARLTERQARGHEALAVMEQHLEDRQYLVGSAITAADLCLYAYTHVASEGGFDLEPYPAVRSWLEGVRAHPSHVSIDAD